GGEAVSWTRGVEALCATDRGRTDGAGRASDARPAPEGRDATRRRIRSPGLDPTGSGDQPRHRASSEHHDGDGSARARRTAARSVAVRAGAHARSGADDELTVEPSPSVTALRVMTFNIRGYWHPGDGVNQWHHREALNVATIRRAAPHLIGFQEAQGRNLKAYKKLLPEYWYTEGPQYGNRPPHEWNAVFWDPASLQPIDSGGFWL